jgi:hypothetical protein
MTAPFYRDMAEIIISSYNIQFIDLIMHMHVYTLEHIKEFISIVPFSVLRFHETMKYKLRQQCVCVVQCSR